MPNNKFIVFAVLLLLIIILISLFVPSHILDIFYSNEHPNGFYAKSQYFYLAVYLLILFSSFFYLFRSISSAAKGSILLRTVFVAFIVISIFQIVGRTRHIEKVISRKNHYLKNIDAGEYLFGFTYSLAVNFKKHLPERCNATVISDLDFNESMPMTLRSIFSYYMLPVNIRSHDQKDNPDCVILFMKRNAKENVPEGYIISYQHDEKNLVAIRKDLSIRQNAISENKSSGGIWGSILPMFRKTDNINTPKGLNREGLFLIDLVNLITSLLMPWFLGYQLLFLILGRSKLNLFMALSLSYGLGLGVWSYIMLLLGMGNIKYTLVNLYTVYFAVLGIILIVKYFFQRRRGSMGREQLIYKVDDNLISKGDNLNTKIIVYLALTYIAYNFILIFVKTFVFPVYTWDSLATCVYNAKLFFYEQKMVPLKYLPHSAYPLGVPLMITWINLNVGYFNEYMFNIIFPIFFLSFAIIFYNFLSYFTNKKWGLLGVVLLLGSNILFYHATISYRDLVLMWFSCSALFLMLWWREEKKEGVPIFSSIVMGLAATIKLEGTAYYCIYCLLCVLVVLLEKDLNINKKLRNIVQFIALGFIMCIIFNLHKFFNNVTFSQHIDLNFSGIVSVAIIFGATFLNNIFFSANWNILWCFLIMSFVIRIKEKKSKEIYAFYFVIALWLGIHFILATTSNSWNDFISGMPRLLIHYFPIVTALIVLLNYPGKKDDTSFK